MSKPGDVLSHWSTLIEGFQTSPLGFYQAVEEALKRRQIPETENSRVDYKESGLLSARREYLHVVRQRLIVDVCGAPFGTGFFISWWLAEAKPNLNPLLKILAILVMLGFAGEAVSKFGLFPGLIVICLLVAGVLWTVNTMASSGEMSDDLIRVLPIIGPLYEWLFKPATYYRIDTMLMFQKAVHNAVLEVLDQITKDQGIRALSELERKPIMKGLLG